MDMYCFQPTHVIQASKGLIAKWTNLALYFHPSHELTMSVLPATAVHFNGHCGNPKSLAVVKDLTKVHPALEPGAASLVPAM